MNISIASFLPLISAIFIQVLGVFVFLKNRKSKLNRIFFLLTIVMTIWLFGTFMMFVSETDSQAIFWDRIVYLGVIFIPVLMYHFSLIFSKAKHPKLLYLGYFLSFVFLILSRTDYFVAGLFKYKWGIHTKAQFFHHVFLIFFSVYLYFFYFNIYRFYKKAKGGLERNQSKYIFIAFLVFLPAALGYLPAYGIDIYPFGYFSGVVFTIVLTYAIIRYRLMDIRVVVKRSTVFSVIVIVLTSAYLLAAFLLSWLAFGGVYTLKVQIIVGLVMSFLISVAFRPFYDWLKRITDTFLFKGEYRPQELMAEISDVLSRTLEMEKIISTLNKKITQALRLTRMNIVILEDGGRNFFFDKEQSFLDSKVKREVVKKIVDYFKKQKIKDVLVLEEIQKKRADGLKFEESFLLIEDLEKLKVFLVVPLFLKEKLIGLFLLGPKKSGDMFTNEDIKTLEAIAAQAAIAIENARLYEEMKDFSRTLQKEVKRQTKSLREANIRLKQLDRAKSEFISIASHQLRTPLSIIKGYLSMILEGMWGSVTPEQKKYLERVYLSNERLIRLVGDLLTVSRIESGRLEFDFKPLDLSKLTKEMVEEFKQLAEEKGIELKYIQPKKSLPKVKADHLKIRQVVQNLIDNAIHYTNKGGSVIIHLDTDGQKVRFSIKDTGIGISPEERLVLFEKFSRGSEVSRMNAEGTGLGLYLAAKFINAHNGKIWVESEGKGKGSTFYFELPALR